MTDGGKMWCFPYTFSCLPSPSRDEHRRIGRKGYSWVVHCNDPDNPERMNHKDNYVQTTKYTAVNFIPKSLFEQFRRVANIYFLVVAFVSFSPLAPYTASSVLFPLIVVIGATMAKEGVEDWKRRRQDVEANSRKVLVCTSNHGFEETMWKKIQVGQLVKVKKGEYFPADLILLSSNYEDGICYVETANLDGETNLKVKHALSETASIHDFQKFKAKIQCEDPNEDLYSFVGTLYYDDLQPRPLSVHQLLLRGSKLRNTDYIYGVVVFTGHDTKVMQNARDPPSKRSAIEKRMDKIIYILFGTLIMIASVGSIFFGVWTNRDLDNGGFKRWYLEPDEANVLYDPKRASLAAFLHFLTALMLYGYLIPISLYVSIEIVKVLQSIFINQDQEMYYREMNKPAHARTSNLNEELGQGNYWAKIWFLANICILVVALVSFGPLAPHAAICVMFPFLVGTGATMAKKGVGIWKLRRQDIASDKWCVEKSGAVNNESYGGETKGVTETGCLSIVLFGASGDLAKKKTFPALFNLYHQGFLKSNDVNIFGYARTKFTLNEFREHIRGYLSLEKKNPESVSNFLLLMQYICGGYDSVEAFQSLDKAISEHEKSKNSIEGSSKRLFYLALPPSVYPFVCRMIKLYCMNKYHGGWTRIIVEKPFGKDSATAEKLSAQIGELFDEPQLYRIDHYLGKELVQNLLVLRFANRFFLPLWNRDNIDNVQIVFKEDFGTEGRGGYFDEYGIIRDIIQNHLLQIFCLVAMEKPISLNPEHIRDEKVKVLQSVNPIKDEEVVLGQYEGYRDDPTVLNKNSNTPTFATMVLRVHNERWEGVPFILKAGKALNSRKAEIRIQFKEVPGDIFKCQKQGRNEFVIRLQPSEAMYMKLTVKKPGLEMSMVQSELDLSYRQRYQGVTIPEAYERLILDTIRGDQQHFVRRDELKVAWEIFTPILHRIDEGELKARSYKPGSRGPAEADDLLKRVGYAQTHGYIWIPPTL